jgi:hypothetical protein
MALNLQKKRDFWSLRCTEENELNWGTDSVSSAGWQRVKHPRRVACLGSGPVGFSGFSGKVPGEIHDQHGE